MKHSLLLLLSCAIITSTVTAQTWNKIGVSNPTTGWADVPSLTIDKSGSLYTAFINFSGQASVMKYNGSTWTTVGGTNVSAGDISTCGEPMALVTDTAGAPYLAYPDTGAKATVMKYNGTGWAPVGAPCFSAGQAVGLAMAIDRNNTPYVVYEAPDTIAPGAVVMKYDGSSWMKLGTGLTTGYANLPSIAIAPDGTPYIAFGDLVNGNKATVYKYTGGSWATVGPAGFSAGPALSTSIVIDNSGTPYITYGDASLTGGVQVMKYNGSSWVAVGAELPSGGSQLATLALDASGTLYVAFADNTTPAMLATVKKYNGSSWVTVGSAGFSAGEVGFIPMVISRTGRPV